MCDPIVIAGLALSAGSAVVNSNAASADTRARDAVLAAELRRQSGFDTEAAALNKQSQERYVDFAPQMAERTGSIGDYLSSSVVPDPNSSAPSPLPSSSSPIINQEIDKQRGAAQDYVDQQTGALANMKAFGDLLGEISIGQGRDATQINTIGGFKRGSQNIVPYELNEAAKAGDGMRFLGDLLGGAGTIATGFGINRGGIASLYGAS